MHQAIHITYGERAYSQRINSEKKNKRNIENSTRREYM